ncbi:MAG: RNA methyltransferase [Bacteroidales bacterium]|nr:RNA methyltransferase [Bacteroidales bacterium]
MNIITINDLERPELDVYARLTEAQLRNRLEPDKGIFIAESLKVVRIALENGLRPLSFLAEQKYIDEQIAPLFARFGLDDGTPVYTGQREVLARLTGYELTRGFLCAMHRPQLPSAEELCRGRRRIAVMDSVVNSTNTGAIFRAATALGIEALLLTPTCCDPLNRRSVRVSMGTVFQMPWSYIGKLREVRGKLREVRGELREVRGELREVRGELREVKGQMNYISAIKGFGFTTVALALSDKSVSIDDPVLQGIDRMAIVMGTEGDGLSTEVIAACDYTAKIPMQRGVDSLNVAAAASVAFWQLRAL